MGSISVQSKFLRTQFFHFLGLRLEGRPKLQLILQNVGWLFFDRFLRMGVGLIVGVWVARYLGPASYGTLNYVIAFVALFSILGILGLDSIVIREVIHNPQAKNEILGSTLALKFLGGIICVCVSLLVALYSINQSSIVLLLIGITSVGSIFQAFDTIDFWFQSQIKAKYTVYSKNIAFILISVIKVFLIKFKAPLIYFAIAGTLEIALGSLFLIIAFQLNYSNFNKWHPQVSFCKKLLKDCWPYLVSGIGIGIFLKIEMIILNSLTNSKTVGLYAAATRVSDLWYFIPSALVSSVMPSILEAKKHNEKLYHEQMQKLFNWIVGLAYVIAVPLTFAANFIIVKLFGNQYIEAGPILSIRIWTAIFVFLGCAHGPFWLAENQQKTIILLTFISAGLNIILNFVLVPKYQGMGAAIAMLISNALPNTLLLLLIPKARPLFRFTCNAIINPFGVISREQKT